MGILDDMSKEAIKHNSFEVGKEYVFKGFLSNEILFESVETEDSISYLGRVYVRDSQGMSIELVNGISELDTGSICKCIHVDLKGVVIMEAPMANMTAINFWNESINPHVEYALMQFTKNNLRSSELNILFMYFRNHVNYINASDKSAEKEIFTYLKRMLSYPNLYHAEDRIVVLTILYDKYTALFLNKIVENANGRGITLMKSEDKYEVRYRGELASEYAAKLAAKKVIDEEV